MRPTFHPTATITKHTGLVYNKQKRAFRITYTRYRNTGQVLVLLDKNYCQFLGYRNRLELFLDNGLDDLSDTNLYHEPYENKLYSIKADKSKQIGNLGLFPLFPQGIGETVNV